MITPTNCPALVVDDVGMMTLLLTQVLRKLGYTEVDRATDPKTALQMIEQKKYGLVLSDIHMEPGGGFELLRQVRANPSTSSTPFIFVTGEISADYVERAKTAGASGYTLKTVGPFEMMENIRYALTAGPHAPFCTLSIASL